MSDDTLPQRSLWCWQWCSQISVEHPLRSHLSVPMRNVLALRGWLQSDQGATGSSDTVKAGSPGNAHCRPSARVRRGKTIFATISEATKPLPHLMRHRFRRWGSIYNPVAACRDTFGANNGLAGGEFDVHRHGRIGCSWLTGTNSSSFEAP